MILIKIRTALALGGVNLARVLLYQLGIKTGLSSVKGLKSDFYPGEFFLSNFETNSTLQPNEYWLDNWYFFGQRSPESGVPDWHKSCLTDGDAPADKPWFQISDFNADLGDVKGFWEASRFDWVVSLAQSAKLGDEDALKRLNAWLNNWGRMNPFYMGVNWKCGQEASIRVMHLALASLILEQTTDTSKVLLAFVKAHLQRVSPTIMYAVAQDNNHGTSEAAALFIGGTWLSINGDPDGDKWRKQGVKWLENRAKRLIEDDGSFSQYSVTYHRVMLDTYSLAEIWRTAHDLPKFSKVLYKKLSLASGWLYYFTTRRSGDAPNLGANDGARLIPLTNTDYRDFRPSVQLANVLFKGVIAFSEDGEYNLPLHWLNISLPERELDCKESKDFSNGGYCYMAAGKLELYINYPSFRFRPSQCDALHLDLWIDGVNIFRDGGTFSYNAGPQYIDYYGGVKSHTTVQFDNHDQMPRLSRFLLGDWLKPIDKQGLQITDSVQSFGVGYKDRFNCRHKRQVELSDTKLLISDSLTGFKDRAICRFRLAPLEWELVGNELSSDCCTIKFSADVTIIRQELTIGKESRYYYQESDLPVLEIEIQKTGTITTEVYF